MQEQIVNPTTGQLTTEGYKVLIGLFDRLDAIAAVTAPTGGATIDAEARTAIQSIIDGAS